MADEVIYNSFKFVIEMLTANQFQTLCHLYLKDNNYHSNLGPIPGRDKAHDIYGDGLNGPFLAHCTIQKFSSKEKKKKERKFREDLIGGVRHCRDAGVEIKREIIVFSCKRAFAPPQEIAFKEDIIPELIEIDDRYTDNPPIIAFIWGDQLAREVCSFGEHGKAYSMLSQNLQKLHRTFSTSGDEQSLLEEDALPSLSCPEDKFLELLSKYSDNLQVEFRQELLREIVASAWNTIVYQPFFANKLLGNEAVKQSKIVHNIIVPLCKAANNISMSSNELKAFLDTLEDDTYFPMDSFYKEHMILITQMLRFLFYHQPEILKSNEIRQELGRLSKKEEMFWDKFFVDLYFRDACNFISIDNELLPIIESACGRYRQEQANKPLVRLWPLISLPLETSVQYHNKEMVELIRGIARDCEDVIECKWCLSALLRIMPLYDCSEEELDYFNLISSLIEEFDRSLVSKSNMLQFMYLESLLRAFIRTKNPKILDTYERRFIQSRDKLIPPQVHHLQLEFASCLYVCCQFLDMETISQSTYGRIILSGGNPLDDILFNNYLFTHMPDLKRKPSRSDKGTLFRWLEAYTNMLYRLYAKRQIEENHLRALQFRASSRVYPNRLLFCNSVLTSLQRFADPSFNFRPSFYGKSTAAFALVPRNKNTDLMRKYVAKALQADKYSVVRNAKYIAECLYSCFYYGEDSNRKEIDQFTERLAVVTEIGNPLPKLHWAYYAGIKYRSRVIEREFLEVLWSHSERTTTKKIHQLALRSGEEVSFEFADTIIEIIRSYSSQGSLFAAALTADFINPEIWNIIGTTVYNNGGESDEACLRMAAYFYSFAKCFARSRKDYDQKYCYNYIRCKALAYKITNTPPEEFFVKDVAFYLKGKASSFFAYKEDCTRHYFDVLEIWWDTFSDEMRELIFENLSKVDWIQVQLSETEDNRAIKVVFRK